MPAEYLITATNGIQYQLDKDEEPSHENLRTAANLGCSALTRLLGDSDFLESVNELRVRRRRGDQRFREITANVDALEQFLGFERELMLTAGMSPRSVDMLLANAEVMLEAIHHAGEVDPLGLLQEIRAVRGDACDLASTLNAIVNDQQQQQRNRGIMVAVGGSALIFVNASVFAASGGLTGGASGVSLGIGGTLISEGYRMTLQDH